MPFPVTEEAIVAAEEELGVRLPSSFREHLIQSNGGEIEAEDDCWKVHPVQDASSRERLRRTADDIVRNTASARGWPGFPSDGIAIAENGSGDRLVFIEDRGNPGSLDPRVYLWLHETGELEELCTDFRALPLALADRDRDY